MSYEDFKAELENVPQTWYPALFQALILAAYRHKVFQPGGASRMAAQIEYMHALSGPPTHSISQAEGKGV